MSFGWSGSDVFLLAQLAWNTVQNSRKACGEYDELTREALRLHAVLQRLEQEVAKSESPINRPGETSKEQLQRIATDCEVVLRQLDKIVAAYASLSEEKRSARKIWQRVRFGNDQMADLGDLRSKMTLYTSEMLLYLNLVSMSTVGRIEQRMDRDGGVLREIKIAVEKKTAHTVLCGGSLEGSVLTTYADDDAKFWRGLRRDLIKDGLPSAAIHKHKHLIKKYVKELAARGILDDEPSKENDQQHDAIHEEPEITEEDQELANNRNLNLNVPLKPDHNAGFPPSEDLIDIIAEDVESQFPRADPCATASQNTKEQLGNTTDDVDIRSGAKTKSQIDYDSSFTEREPHIIPPMNSVPIRAAKMRSRTSKNKTKTSRKDAAKAGAPDYAARKDTLSHASSYYGLFLRSTALMQGGIEFVVTHDGSCHKASTIRRKASTLLLDDFEQRINVMLECLPDHSPQWPQILPGAYPNYIADINVIATYAQSAQEIIRDIGAKGGFRNPLPTSLVDFRPVDFIDALDIPVHDKVSQGLCIRLYELIASFDGQCYDVVHRVRQFNAWKGSGYPRHAMPTSPLPTHEGAHNDIPTQQHPLHMRSGEVGAGRPSNRSFHFSTSAGGSGFNASSAEEIFASFFRASEKGDDDDIFSYFASSKDKIVGASENRNSDDSSSSKSEPHRSATYQPSPEFKDRSIRRSETMPVEQMRPANPMPLTSSNLKNMKAPSHISSIRRSETMPVDQMRPASPMPLKPSNRKNKKALWNTSDGGSESGCEELEDIYPPPRKIPFQRQPRAYAMEPEEIQPGRGESHRTPLRSAMGSGSSHVLFGEVGPHDKTESDPGYSSKTSEDDEPQRCSPDDPLPHTEGVSIRYDDSSHKHEAASSQGSQGSSPLDEINAINHIFQTDFEPQCQEFQKNPPPHANERKKLYDKLSETILQHVLLKVDAVNAEGGMQRVKKKQLIICAQFALAQLDKVMGAG